MIVNPPTGNPATDTQNVVAAVTSVSGAGGGIVELQAGTYAMNDEVSLPASVVLTGQGRAATNLSWAADLGADRCAVRQTGGAQRTAPSMRDLSLVGPYDATTSYGVQGCLMDGFLAGSNPHVAGCYVGRFRAGLVLVRDHGVFTCTKVSNNYFNVLAPAAATSHGNHQFAHCELDGAGFACLAAEGGNIFDSCLFSGGHVGFAPYCFYKFDGGAPSTLGLFTNTVFDNCCVEAVGNGVLLDESTGNGSGADTVVESRFEHGLGFGAWDDTRRVTGRPRDWAIKARNIVGAEFSFGPYSFPRGTAGDIYGASVGSTFVVRSGFVPVFSGCDHRTRIVSRDGWEGRLLVASTATITGQVVEGSGPNLGVAPCGTNTGNFIGVAMQSAAAGTPVVVAVQGVCRILADPVPTSGALLYPRGSVNGYASTSQTGASRPIGVVVINNGGVTGAAVTARLL